MEAMILLIFIILFISVLIFFVYVFGAAGLYVAGWYLKQMGLALVTPLLKGGWREDKKLIFIMMFILLPLVLPIWIMDGAVAQAWLRHDAVAVRVVNDAVFYGILGVLNGVLLVGLCLPAGWFSGCLRGLRCAWLAMILWAILSLMVLILLPLWGETMRAIWQNLTAFYPKIWAHLGADTPRTMSEWAQPLWRYSVAWRGHFVMMWVAMVPFVWAANEHALDAEKSL